jgi:hypothetical protein
VKLVQLNEQTLWYAAGVGLVRRETAFEIYENGVFVDADAWTEVLSSGSFGGVPFP